MGKFISQIKAVKLRLKERPEALKTVVGCLRELTNLQKRIKPDTDLSTLNYDEVVNCVGSYNLLKQTLRDYYTHEEIRMLTREFFKTDIVTDDLTGRRYYPLFLCNLTEEGIRTTLATLLDKNIYYYDLPNRRFRLNNGGEISYKNYGLRLGYPTKVERFFNNGHDKSMFKSLDTEATKQIKLKTQFKTFQNPIHDSTLYMGVELEVVRKPKTPDNIMFSIYEDLNPNVDINRIRDGYWDKTGISLAFCKRDGSLPDHGFEICSVPATLAYHRTAWDAFFANSAKHLGSYIDPRCGIHVHLSKAAFESNLHKGKFIKFYNSKTNTKFLRIIAARSTNAYCVASEKKVTHFKDGRGATANGHRDIVNTEPAHTIEVRMFRGNVKKEGFMKNLDFVHASFNFCRETSINKLDSQDFLDWLVKPANLVMYPYLTKWLKVRDLIDTKLVKLKTSKTHEKQSVAEDFVRDVA